MYVVKQYVIIEEFIVNIYSHTTYMHGSVPLTETD